MLSRSKKSTYGDSRGLEQLGGSFYLPNTDIDDPGSNGIKIFKPFSKVCFKEIPKIRKTQESKHEYSNLQEFYSSVATDTGVDGKLTGKYTMGLTLNMKTSRLSLGSIDVKGSSIEIATHIKEVFLDENCYGRSVVEFSDDFLKTLDSLSPVIHKPWLSESWEKYGLFLKQFGSHFIVRILLGASVRQWTFAKSFLKYTARQMVVKTCFDVNGSDLELGTCVGVTKEEYEKYKDISTSNYVVVRGGKDETRSKFQTNKTRGLLKQLLNEGRTLSSPISFKYKPVWDVLMIKFRNNTRRYAIASNLKQYYYGLRDFGCTFQKNGNTKMRSFDYRVRKITQPIFQCFLINKGCHSNSDCHIGGAGTVTYCYGSSCYDYKSPTFGNKATNVIIRWSKKGSYNEGINNSCDYKVGVAGACDYNYYGGSVIWDGSDLFKTREK